MNTDEKRALINEFEKNRHLLGSIVAQKKQLTIQVEVMKKSLEELNNTTEKSVYKAVGNVLIPKSTSDMIKELKEKVESSELRLKTVDKQEESSLKKLNSLKSKIEGKEGKETEEVSEDKSDKKRK